MVAARSGVSPPAEPAAVAPALLNWWDGHGRRDLPWQRNPTPYRVWVSEIMLQQTQVSTVARYYERFLAAFPEVIDLADAAPDEVLHHWSGLGYYARARNLHRAAAMVRDEHGGQVPLDRHALEALPGVGRSTAGAVLALAAGQRHPILDGNVKRVLTRCFGISGWPGQTAVARQLWDLAEACTPDERVANYTQAIMDLGASICVRRKPRCGDCPLAAQCVARSAGCQDELPSLPPRRARPRRETTLVVVIRESDNAVLLERRAPQGIWGGLWGFPEVAEPGGVADWVASRFGITPRHITPRPVISHGFTHFDLDMVPVEVRLTPAGVRALEEDRWLWYNSDKPARIGLAAPVARLLETIGEFNEP